MTKKRNLIQCMTSFISKNKEEGLLETVPEEYHYLMELGKSSEETDSGEEYDIIVNAKEKGTRELFVHDFNCPVDERKINTSDITEECIWAIYIHGNWTGMMKNWKNRKNKFTKVFGEKNLLLYQVGTFYEFYFHDVLVVEKELNLLKTLKSKFNKLSAPMLGFPVENCKKHKDTLLSKGYTLLVIDQVDDNENGTKKRSLTEVLTPSTNLLNNSNDYTFLYSIYYENNILGCTITDISTNNFYILQEELTFNSVGQYLKDLFESYPPREILYNKGFTLTNGFGYISENLEDINFIKKELPLNYKEIVSDYIGEGSIISFERKEELHIIYSMSICYDYINNIYDEKLTYLNSYTYLNTKDTFRVESSTLKSLEILKNITGYKKNSLYEVLDKTSTPLGKRQLQDDLKSPLTNIKKINERLESIEYLHNNDYLYTIIRTNLNEISDIKRLASTLVTSHMRPGHLLKLSFSLKQLNKLKEFLLQVRGNYLKTLGDQIETYDSFIEEVEETLTDTGDVYGVQGGFIKEGISEKLDELILLTKGKDKFLASLKEKILTQKKYSNLKIVTSKINTDIHLEIKKDEKPLEGWSYIKSLVSGVRYTCPEIEEFRIKYLTAEVEKRKLEEALLSKLRLKLSKYVSSIHTTANIIGRLDVLCSHTTTAKLYNYTRPTLNESYDLDIINGRHPIIEQLGKFTSNNTLMNEKSSLHIITGANMGGKSTYLRQVALIVLMSQIGSYVPCSKATIGLVDNIFTRIGASDNLSEGQSTYYLEVSEANNMIRSSTNKTLLIFDELGRGTSVSDGLAITRSICKYISKRGIRTLFATHYHELNDEISQEEKLFNKDCFFVKTEMTKDGDVKFLHKVLKGKSYNSYGVEIGKLAGLPQEIIKEALNFRNEYNTSNDIKTGIIITEEDKLYNEQNKTKNTDEVTEVSLKDSQKI